MKTMSSKDIKDHYGDFVEAARREPVVHTNHGRPTLVTISFERAQSIPELSADISPAKTEKCGNVLLEAMGKGTKLSAFKSTAEVDKFVRDMRDAWE